MRPLRNNLIVQMEESLPNQAGLYIPTDISKYRTAKDQISNRGLVVMAGPGKRHKKTGTLLETQCKVGDVVRFSELEFPSFISGGQKYVVINEGDIVGIEHRA